MESFLQYFRPKKYKLKLTIDRTSESLVGSVIIEGCLVQNAKFVRFHAKGLKILSAKMKPVTKNEFEKCDFSHTDGILEIPVSSSQHNQPTGPHRTKIFDDPAIISFEIEFSGRLNRNMLGCYLSKYNWQGKEMRIAATQFEACCAREAFPCLDEPAAKAIFELTLCVPDLSEQDIVIANMPLRRQKQQNFEFEPTPPMSTYLLAWVIGPFHKVSATDKDGICVSSYCALNQSVESLTFANQTGERALEYYRERFGVPYPLPKLDQVALPDFEAGAMENWGLVTFRESCMLADQNAALDSKRSVAVTVTHEIAHQWFGDLVTMKWWDDLWLNESFATIMEFAATNAIYPEFKIWTDFFTNECVAALERDALPGVQAVYQPVHHPDEIETLFDSAIVYAKGARLVFMLMRLMGEAKFNQGLHDYFEKYQYANTVGDDLWANLQPYAEFDVGAFMQAWISQPGYPVLQHFQNEAAEQWKQQRLLIDGSTDDSKWPLPEIRDDMSGHYLINLGDEEFQDKLMRFEELSEEQKVRLLIDRMLLAKVGMVSTVSLLDLLPKFSTEQNPGVWQILASIITDLKIFCPAESTTKHNFQKYLRQLLATQLARFKNAQEKLSVDQLDLRSTVMSIALYAADRETLERLVRFYRSDLTKIESELRTLVLGAKLRADESSIFADFLAQYQVVEDPDLKADLLYTLSRAEMPEHRQKLLSLLDDSEIVRPQDHIFLFIYLLRNPRTKDATLTWLPEHWAKIERMTGQKTAEDYLRYGASVIINDEEAQKFFEFFDQKIDNPMYARGVELAHVSVAARLDRIQKYQAAFDKKLAELVKKNANA